MGRGEGDARSLPGPRLCPRGHPRGAEPFVMLIRADITPHIKAEGAAYKAAPGAAPPERPRSPRSPAWAEVSGDRRGCEALPGEVGRGQRLGGAPRNAEGAGLAKNRGLRGVARIPRRGDASSGMRGRRKTPRGSTERGFLEAAKQTEEMTGREAAWRLQGRRETRRTGRRRETQEDAWGRENGGNAKESRGLETARDGGYRGNARKEETRRLN